VRFIQSTAEFFSLAQGQKERGRLSMEKENYLPPAKLFKAPTTDLF